MDKHQAILEANKIMEATKSLIDENNKQFKDWWDKNHSTIVGALEQYRKQILALYN